MIVISNGMLRSGSTLQYNIAAGILETRGPLKRGGFLGDFKAPETRKKLDEMKARDDWTIVKTHEAPLEPEFYDDRVRVLFSYRDVRDIAASIKKKWGYPFDQIVLDIGKMIEIEQEFSRIPDVLVQSYDKLFTDLPGATREIAEFLQVSLTDETVSRVAAEYSIKEDLGANGKPDGLLGKLKYSLVGKNYDRKTLYHDDHISATRGQAGDWNEQFTQDEIQILNSSFATWLDAHDYTA